MSGVEPRLKCSSMTECSHGMPDPAACVECMAEGNVAPPPQVEPERRSSRVFSARYDGHCGGCNLPIHEQQSVVFTTRDRVVHAGCVPDGQGTET